MARPSRFSPRSEPHAELEQRTVGREDLCASVVRGIADAVRAGQARFDLVLGPRGAGKSHLLGLVEGRLRKELEAQAVVVGLPEELHPSSLVHLLAEILRGMPPDPDAGPVERSLAILASSPEDARERAVAMIGARLRGLPLIIVVENLDIIFAAIRRDGQHRLRSILQTERCWSIVASSRSWAPSLAKESEPFFGMFVPRTLEPMSAEDCRAMLVRLAHACGREQLARELDTPTGLARVQTLRHVLGGYPRAMAFIFPHLDHERPDAVEQALRDLAEELTPYFQEQMSRLPPGQRPVAELLAEHWVPLSVGEIASATFNSQPTVSTYLRRMREDAIVRSTELGRERFYEIADPLFRIARAMKREDLRAKAFLRVLQSWYELRGFDVWRLPTPTRVEICGPALDDTDSEYGDTLFEPFWQELEGRRFRRLLELARASESSEPRRVAFEIVALGHLGRDEESFSVLAGVGSSRVQAIMLEVVIIEEEVSQSTSRRRRRPVRPSLVGRFCGAVLSVHEDDEPTLAIETIEQVLQSDSRTIREAATRAVLEFSVPATLAQAGRYEHSGRVIALLEPVGSEALSFNLAWTAVVAWAADQLHVVFRRSTEQLVTLVEGLNPFAYSAMILLKQETAEVPPSLAQEVERLFADGIANGSLHASRYSPADWLWLAMFVISIVRNPFVEKLIQYGYWLDDDVHRARMASVLHGGILYWIASGRSLEPITSALALERSLTGVGGPSITLHTNPDVSYVRLAAPERATVRELAASLGLEDRHARLCSLSDDEE